MKKTKVKLATCLLSSMLLVACGGSDAPTANSNDGSSIAAGGVVVITSIDGYYKNGLLFLDKNGNGELDLDIDTIFGLTDASGQYAIPEGTTGTLGLQTLVPGGDMQKSLISSDPAYTGIYTVDMDFPDQPVSSEIVLQAPATSTVISPVTDLVSILMAEGSTEADAQSAVVDALGLTEGTDLYIDFVAADTADAELHKVAQILADSKAAISDDDDDSNDDDYTDNVLLVAQAAAAQVETIIADDAANSTNNISDNSVSAVITVDTSTEEVTTTTVSNVTATVSTSVYNSLQAELDDLTIVQGEPIASVTLEQSLVSLITDTDQIDQTTSLSTITLYIQDSEGEAVNSLTTGGISFSLTDNKLSLSTSEKVTATEDISLFLMAKDRYSDDSSSDENVVSNIYVEFIIDVNGTPTVNATTEASLAATIADWELVVGESVDKTLNISELFVDPDDDTLTYGGGITTTGLEVEFSGTTLSVTGTPTVEGESSTLTLSASDASGSKFVEFALPTVIAVDSDSDGVDDYLDTFPDDASETTDSDEDDNADAFPNDATETSDNDGDGIGDNADTDEETTNTSPLIGTWSNAEDILTFNTDGTYEHTNLQDDDEDCTVGTETGTYTYDEATGGITATSMTSNGDGDCGFYDEDGFGSADDDSFVLSEAGENGNYLVFAIDEDSDSYEENSMTVYKVIDTSASDFVAANSNFFFLDLELDDGDIEFSYDDVKWSSEDNIISSTCYVFDFDSDQFTDCTDTDDSDYILTSEGWGYANYGDSTLTPQSDGSMVYADNIESETITGVEWSLSGSNIYQFQKSVGIEDSLLTYFDDSATFSDDAALYVMTSVSNSEPVYSLWLNNCDDTSTSEQISVGDTGYCNTQYDTTDGSAVTSIASITASTSFSATGSTNQADFKGMKMYDYLIRLVEGDSVGSGSVDVYDNSLNQVSGTVTWQKTTVYGYTFINFNTEDDSLSSFNQLVLTEVGGYVRGADMWGDSDEDDDIDIMFNSIAAQNLLDAFDTESVDSSSSVSTTSSTLTATVENEVAVLTSEFNNYDEDIDSENKLQVINSSDISQISTDIKLANLGAPSNESIKTYIELGYGNNETGDDLEVYSFAGRLMIRVYEDRTIISPSVGVCRDSECDSYDDVTPDASDDSNILTDGMEIDTPTGDFVNMGIVWDEVKKSFIFTYGGDTATISLDSYELTNYSFNHAGITTRFSGDDEGESFSATTYLDNVYVNDTLYDDFSSGDIDSYLWWSSALDESSSDSSDRTTYNISTGTVTFDIDSNTSVPDDAMVRIVPNTYSEADNYSMALICDIDESGSFGTDCLIYEGQEDDFDTVLADDTETYQFAVFQNHLNTDEYHWDCGENVYKFVGESVNSWTGETTVVAGDYQDRSAETCTD